MNTAPQATPEASTEATPANAETSADETFEKLAKSLTFDSEEGLSEAGSDDAKETPAKKDDDKEGEEPAVDPERAARQARREALRAKELERIERNARYKERAQPQVAPPEEVTRLQAEVQRLKAIEESLRDPARFIDMAQAVGADPLAIHQFLEKSVNDPAAMIREAATKQAREAVDPALEAVRKELAELKQFQEQQLQQARDASERAAEAELLAHASKLGETSAVNAFREVFGDAAIVQLANSLIPELPRGSTLLDLLDLVEERCSEPLQRLQARTSKQPKNPEHPAQKNISARTRAERSAIEDPEAEWEALDVDERFRRIERSLQRS